MPSNKTASNETMTQIKRAMVNYIGPIFQELKGDLHEFKRDTKAAFSNLNNRVDSLTDRVDGLNNRVDGLTDRVDDIKEKTHRLGIVVEQMDQKIDTALEASSSVLRYEEVVRDHGARIDHLERDVRVLKVVKSQKP